MKNLPRIELKNISLNKALSDETPCFSASIYLDGKRFCTVTNRGHGGDDEFHPVPPRNQSWQPGELAKAYNAVRDKIAEIDEFLLKRDGVEIHERADGSIFKIQNNTLSYIVYGLLDDHEQGKALRSLLKRKMVWQTPNGAVYEGNKPKPFALDDAKDVLQKVHPGARLLNSMPFEKALEIYKTL